MRGEEECQERESGFERRAALFFLLLFVAAVLVQAFSYRVPFVYRLYDAGTLTLFSGGDPYPAEWRVDRLYGEWFLYPPFFALVFYPFSTDLAGTVAGPIAWMLINLAVFFTGIMAFLETLGGTVIFRRWRYAAALLLVANELLGATLAGQANALVAGLMLWSCAFYLRDRPAGSGILLALAASLKVYPIALLLILALGGRRSFIVSAAGVLLFTFIVPSAVAGWTPLLGLYTHLGAIFSSDPVHPTFLSLQPTLLAFGWAVPSFPFMLFMMANAGTIAAAALPLRHDPQRLVHAALPLTLAFIILFNQRTEGLSFILLTPVLLYMFRAHLAAKDRGDGKEAQVQLWFLAATWLSISYFSSDLCPSAIRTAAAQWHVKTLGGVLAYAWGWRVLLRGAIPRQRTPMSGAADPTIPSP